MKWKTGPTGLTVLILFIQINAATGPDHRDECKDVQLSCSESRDAAVGEAVTLDCHFEPQCDVKDESIVWKFNKSVRVLVYRSRNFSLDVQADSFRGRASADSSWKQTEGKLALKISPVKITDAGTYTCSFGTGPPKNSCSTKLNIKQQVEEKGTGGEQAQGKADGGDPTESPRLQDKHDTGIGIGALIGIIGLIGIGIIALIGFGIYKCKNYKRAPPASAPEPALAPAPEAGPAPAPEAGPAPAPALAPELAPAPEPEAEHDPRPCPRWTEDRGYTRQRSKETDNPEEIPLMNKGSTSGTSD